MFHQQDGEAAGAGSAARALELGVRTMPASSCPEHLNAMQEGGQQRGGLREPGLPPPYLFPAVSSLC